MPGRGGGLPVRFVHAHSAAWSDFPKIKSTFLAARRPSGPRRLSAGAQCPRVEGPAVAFAFVFRTTAVEREPAFLLPVPCFFVSVVHRRFRPAMDETSPLTPTCQLANAANAAPTRQFVKSFVLLDSRFCFFLGHDFSRAESARPFFEKQSTRRSRDQTYRQDRLPRHHPRHANRLPATNPT